MGRDSWNEKREASALTKRNQLSDNYGAIVAVGAGSDHALQQIIGREDSLGAAVAPQHRGKEDVRRGGLPAQRQYARGHFAVVLYWPARPRPRRSGPGPTAR